MTDEPLNQSSNVNRYREASDWLVRLSASPPMESVVERWLAWCEEDPENLVAFELMQRDWNDLEALRAQPDLLIAAGSIDDDPMPDARSMPAPRSYRSAVRWAAAAALSGIVVLGYVHWAARPSMSRTVAATQRSPTTLPDGTSLLLSAKASAEINFTRADRELTLKPGGEAFIRVRHHKSWPFVVRAGSVTITDVGTAFDVRREPGHVTVMVTEGVVDLSAPGADGLARWQAVAGYQIDYSERAHTAAVSSIDPNSVLSWRRGELAYDGTPLSTVIADVNRYSDMNVIVSDPRVGQLRYSGTVFVTSIRDWLSALAAKYPVVVSERADNSITLQMAPSGMNEARRQD